MPRGFHWPLGGGLFLMSEVLLYKGTSLTRNRHPPTIGPYTVLLQGPGGGGAFSISEAPLHACDWVRRVRAKKPFCERLLLPVILLVRSTCSAIGGHG